MIAEGDNKKTFINFCSLSKNRLALIKNKTIGFALFDIDKKQIVINKEKKSSKIFS